MKDNQFKFVVENGLLRKVSDLSAMLQIERGVRISMADLCRNGLRAVTDGGYIDHDHAFVLIKLPLGRIMKHTNAEGIVDWDAVKHDIKGDA